MMLSGYLTVAAVLVAQAPPAEAKKLEEAAARLALMQKSVAGYTMHLADDAGESYRLKPEPCLRFTNTIGGSRDGAVFVWLGKHGRPEVVTQLLFTRDGSWQQELSSLAAGPLTADWKGQRIWTPSKGGVAFKPVPDGPAPAGTAEERLRQMHAITRNFTVEDQFRSQSWQPLRLLAKPCARYGKPGSSIIDGALFAYVLTTDPEVFLMLEARADQGEPRWHYAFAPMTVFAVKGSWKGKEVWSLPFHVDEAGSPSSTFHALPAPGIE
jgi:hypothetical protein